MTKKIPIVSSGPSYQQLMAEKTGDILVFGLQGGEVMKVVTTRVILRAHPIPGTWHIWGTWDGVKVDIRFDPRFGWLFRYAE